MSRLSIYVQLAHAAPIVPVGGDRIETIRFMRTLNKFADVYYNDELFQPNAENFGLTKKEITLPTRTYDLYYVRANSDLFRRLPSPKVTMAYPYDPRSFAEADALLVTTDEWRRLLLDFNRSASVREMLESWYPAQQLPLPDQIINIRQTIDPAFEAASPTRVSQYRAILTNGFVFGYFGRINTTTLPNIFLEAYDRLRRTSNRPIVAIGGRITCNLPRNIIDMGRIDYADMPNVVHACDALLANEERDAEFLGSGKVLEGIGARIPLIVKRTAARQEHLGTSYPLYYENAEDAFELASKLISSPELIAEAKEYLSERYNIFSIDAQACWLERQFSQLIREKGPSQPAAQ